MDVPELVGLAVDSSRLEAAPRWTQRKEGTWETGFLSKAEVGSGWMSILIYATIRVKKGKITSARCSILGIDQMGRGKNIQPMFGLDRADREHLLSLCGG